MKSLRWSLIALPSLSLLTLSFASGQTADGTAASNKPRILFPDRLVTGIQVKEAHSAVRQFAPKQTTTPQAKVKWKAPRQMAQILPQDKNGLLGLRHPLLTPEDQAKAKTRNLLLTEKDMEEAKCQLVQEKIADPNTVAITVSPKK